jgi:hypothetical protein
VIVAVTVRDIIAAEAREWSELEPGEQKSTGAQPVKI